MKNLKKLLQLILCMSICFSCTETDEFIDDPSVLKSAKEAGKTKVMPSTATDASVKAQEDWQNINDALQNTEPGEVVQLAEGLFYLHKSIIRWDFHGTLKGSGMDKTIIQTVPGELFNVEECPSVNWSLEENDGGFMFCFPHDFTDDERTVTVSDLSIVVSEPTTPYLRWKNTVKEMEFNSLQAIIVFYTNLNNDMANPIHLNVLYKNITITGEKDEKYLYNSFSIFHGLAAYGLSNGTFEAKNVHIENASGCITPFAFYGDDATVTVKNASLKSCKWGIFSLLNHSWTILNNEIENSTLGIVMLKQSVGGELLEGPDGISFVKDNKIHFMGVLGLGVQNLKNVQVKDNVFEGSGRFGGIAGLKGGNWIITDNDLCGVAPVAPFNCTIFLNNLKNSEINDNANQVVGGPGASDPTIIIGEGRECNED
ncbi:MAG: right-handed parallel beta-helix repeat-containing protein [Bacteroidota bacterium]